MRYGALNVDAYVNYSQANNIREIADGPAFNWCSVETLASGRAALIPQPETIKNEYGGEWRTQEGDYLADYFRTPANLKKFKKIRLLNYNKYPPEQVPQLHPIGLKEVFNLDSKFIKYGTFDDIVKELKVGNVVELCMIDSNPLTPEATGHYVLANQYDDMLDKISFKDPAKEVVKWLNETLDKDGNKWLNRMNYTDNFHKWHVVIYKPKG